MDFISFRFSCIWVLAWLHEQHQLVYGWCTYVYPCVWQHFLIWLFIKKIKCGLRFKLNTHDHIDKTFQMRLCLVTLTVTLVARQSSHTIRLFKQKLNTSFYYICFVFCYCNKTTIYLNTTNLTNSLSVAVFV